MRKISGGNGKTCKRDKLFLDHQEQLQVVTLENRKTLMQRLSDSKRSTGKATAIDEIELYAERA